MQAAATPRFLAPTPSALAAPWILRIGLAGCFVGHGAFGIITKSAWVPYFAVAGVSEPHAWQLMPWIGAMDIAMGLLALAWPCRALFLWAGLWAVWTALLRPLSGEPIWECLERAGNYGVPFALLVLAGWRGDWFARWTSPPAFAAERRRSALAWTLRLTTATLLIGHAGLGLFTQKPALAAHYSALGLNDPTTMVPLVGAAEFLLAAVVLLRPRPGVLIAACGWKLASESLFLMAGAPVWELIERFGSYTAPLALAWLFLSPPSPASISATPADSH